MFSNTQCIHRGPHRVKPSTDFRLTLMVRVVCISLELFLTYFSGVNRGDKGAMTPSPILSEGWDSWGRGDLKKNI